MKTFLGLAMGLSLAALIPLSLAQSDKSPDPPKGNPSAGGMVFEDKCTECHNSDSEETKIGPGLKGIKEGRLPSGQAANRQNILDLLMEGREEMPSFKDILSQKQKEDVIAFVLTL